MFFVKTLEAARPLDNDVIGMEDFRAELSSRAMQDSVAAVVDISTVILENLNVCVVRHKPVSGPAGEGRSAPLAGPGQTPN